MADLALTIPIIIAYYRFWEGRVGKDSRKVAMLPPLTLWTTHVSLLRHTEMRPLQIWSR